MKLHTDILGPDAGIGIDCEACMVTPAIEGDGLHVAFGFDESTAEQGAQVFEAAAKALREYLGRRASVVALNAKERDL